MMVRVELAVFRRACRLPPVSVLLAFVTLAWLMVCAGRAESPLDYEITVWRKENGLPHDEILGITQTLEGYLWIATPKGLARFDGSRFKLYGSSDLAMSKAETIGGLQCDAAGNLWLITSGGSIVRGRSGIFTRLTDESAAPAAGAHGVYSDGNRQVIISSRLGEVFRAAGDRLEAWLPARSQTSDRYVGINVGLDGTVVVRHGFVLSWWDDATWQKIKAPDGSDLHALKTGASQEGGMWISTREGLRRFRNGRWDDKELRFPQLLPSIQQIVEDSRRNVWISTGANGLLRFDPDGNATTISVAHGLSHESVRHLFEDAEGNLWAGTEGGLNRLRPMGHARGSTELSRNQTPRTPWTTPRLLVQEIRSDGNLVWEEPSPQLSNASRAATSASAATIPLPLGVRAVEVAFAALSFSASHPARLQCRVDGLDRDWINLDDHHVVGFTNLPPRRYRFRLRAAHADGSWSAEGASLSFAVLPRYWQTWWFRSSAVIALAGGLAWLYHVRVSGLMRRQALQQSFAQRLIQSQEDERKRIAADLHDSLGQKLLVIKNCAQFGLSDLVRTDEVREQLERVSCFASESLDEIRQIARNLRPYQLDQMGLTKTIRSLAAQIEQSSALQVRLDLDPLDELFPRDQEINVYRIVQEGLNNAVRHASATEIRVRAENRGTELHLTLADDGQGFDTQARAKAGFGLSNIRERVQLLGGELQIHSSLGAGTRLFARLPIQNKPHEG